MKVLKITFVLLLLVLVLSPAKATPIPVYGTAAPLSGSTDLLGFGNWAGNANLSWTILPVAGGYNYMYTFTHLGSDLSHLVLEFTAGCGADPACITDATSTPDGPRLYEAFAPPNFEMPAAIYGVKFNFTGGSPNILSFVSNRAPVWGDVYLRDGSNAYAYNGGLTNHSSTSVLDFVARPDGDAIPEPTGWLLFGIGLVLVSLHSAKKKT